MFMVIRRGIAFCNDPHVLYLLLTAYEAYYPVPVNVARVTRNGRLSYNFDWFDIEKLLRMALVCCIIA